jgi:hypothetical protein
MAESQARRAHRAGAAGRELPEPLRQAADDNPEIVDAYDHGRAGGTWDQYVRREPPDQSEPPKPAPASSAEPAGPEPEPEPAPASPPPAPAASGRVRGGTDAGDVLAGVVLGAIAYALLLALVNYGPSGPVDWLKAKFLNQPVTSVGSGSSTSSGALPPDKFGQANATTTSKTTSTGGSTLPPDTFGP